ncbi:MULTISPECIES: 2-hydroxyacid dehydrogenase [Prauserella salsuginis group]|uniref:Phosphoglycerate dehydrogenase-like enzyme n=2 Tax=Prauserella salsuginis group TaxID=2893672 RepID=A0A839XL88_9PSEU|nr:MULTISPECIES: 2-hydroxyacid dehydrogenase [Prauserella salsuginis group]MBB3661503.1 phosphoglycerate dehydrogenase-like enzyme [Prauserella sediminis]MCR3719422.1 Phosphoglycerate dehydrogenase [Prauserella flava]MCR3735564.1 Phosphoglycerate dehydrogenase [Prauserella salsuginis]
MAITVLVPDDDGMTALTGIDGVQPVRYEPGQPLPEEAVDAEVLVPGFGVTEKVLSELPKLRLIQLRSAGAEEWIDVVPPGVLLSTCRGAHGGSTAEWAVATLLSLYRELPDFQAAHAEGVWRPHGTDTLQGKRAVIVGAGDVGRQLERRLVPFDVRVTMVGMTARDGVHGVDELPSLLGQADIVALLVPLTSKTRGMVDAGFLAAMPDGAVLVNAARGPVLDTDALLDELTARRLRAILDVTEPEPLPAGHPLWTAPNVMITPHTGGFVDGRLARSYAIVARELERYAGGELPENLVHGEY